MQNSSKYSYTIDVPDQAEDHVIEWFEFMSSQGVLSAEVIRLVEMHIAIGQQSAGESKSCFEYAYTPQEHFNNDSEDIFNSLYKWEESTAAALNCARKEKKKMLSV